MRILVVGAGALGGVIATKLTLAGFEVVALESNQEHASACRMPGLLVELPDGSTVSARIEVVDDIDRLASFGSFDYALITLKAPKLAEVLGPLSSSGNIRTFVSLGNGLVQPIIADIVGSARLLVGTVSWGATFVRPGHVRQTTLAPIAVGDPSGEQAQQLAALLPVLGEVAITHATDRVFGQIWSKLLLNSSLSGLGTVAGDVYSAVASDPTGRRLILDLWTEGFHVAQKLGVQLDEVAGIDPAELVVDGRREYDEAGLVLDSLMTSIGATNASMLQDIRRGIKTEVDVINGGVASAGRSTGMSTPLNDSVVAIVHRYERGELQPGFENLTLLRNLSDPSHDPATDSTASK